MSEGEQHLSHGRHVRLGSFPRGLRPARGISHVADRDVTDESVEGIVIEHLGHESQVLGDVDRLAISDGDARAFLPPVLQCLQAKARHAGDILARCVDSKYATFLVHRRTHLPVASPKLTRGLYTSRVSPSFQAGKSISDRGSRRRESRAGAPRFRAGSRPKGLGRSMAWSRGCPRTPGSVSSFPRTAPCWSGACR